MNIIDRLKGKVVVSVQAMPSEPLYQEDCINAMMKSVVKGGAGALRVAGVRDVKNAKKLFDVPVIGLTKPNVIPANYKEIVYITPTLKEVISLVEAGADVIMLPMWRTVEDVKGFIKNRAAGYKCIGCWKVYGNEQDAKKQFERYKKCTSVYCAQWANGKSIEQLTVAV